MFVVPSVAGAIVNRCSDFAMPTCMVATLIYLTTGMPLAPWLARFALLIYLIAQAKHVSAMAKAILAAASVGTVITFLFYHTPVPIILEGFDKFCYFATFVASIGLLRTAAMRSQLIREAGRSLVNQRPALRYPALSLGTAVFGIIINIGALSLFGSMIKKGNSLENARGDLGVRALREQRMTLALLRGFALTPLISPMGIAVIVILSKMPEMTWGKLVPLALPVAAVVFAIGWALDSRLRPAIAPVPSNRTKPTLLPLWRFCVLVFGITLTTAFISVLGDMGLPVAVLISCPLCAFIWLAIQRRRLGGGYGAARASALIIRDSKTIFGSNRSEIVVLGGSALIGTLIVPLVGLETLNQLVTAAGMHGMSMVVCVMLLVLTLGQIGLNPVISVTLILSLLQDSRSFGVEPQVLATALMSSWALSMMSSPFTTVLLIVSKSCDRSPYYVAWYWNGIFYGVTLPAVTVVLWVAHASFGNY